MAIFRFFSKWRPSAMLDLFYACLDHPRRVFAGVYHWTEYCWNRLSSFHNMQVLICNEFGLKMPIHAQNGIFWEGILVINGEQSHRGPQRATPCAEARHTTYRSLRSVHAFCTAHCTAFLYFTMGRPLSPPKLSLPVHGRMWTQSNTWFL